MGKRRSSRDTGMEMKWWRSTEWGHRRRDDGAGRKRGGGAASFLPCNESPARPLGSGILVRTLEVGRNHPVEIIGFGLTSPAQWAPKIAK